LSRLETAMGHGCERGAEPSLHQQLERALDSVMANRPLEPGATVW
jgi:hypothetical protein